MMSRVKNRDGHLYDALELRIECHPSIYMMSRVKNRVPSI